MAQVKLRCNRELGRIGIGVNVRVNSQVRSTLLPTTRIMVIVLGMLGLAIA